MKIVLLKEVRGLGRAGDVKEVSEGYARNFLIARGLAAMISKNSIELLQAQKNKRERIDRLELKNKKKLAGKLNGKSFTIKAKADEKGTLYFKITPKLIVEELARQKLEIGEKDLKIIESIKKVGEYEIGFKIAGERGIIKLVILALKSNKII